MKTFSPPENMYARNAFRISLITGSVMLLTAVVGAISGWSPRSIASDGVMVLIALIAAVLSRRGRAGLGVGLMLGVLWFLLSSTPFLLDGFGLTAATLVIVFTLGISLNTLPPRRAGRVIGASIGLGVLIVLLDVFGRAGRPQVAVSPIVPVIILAVLAIYAFFFSRQFTFSLRAKLVVAFLIVALLPLAILFFINDSATRRNLTESANRALSVAGTAAAEDVDGFITEGLNDVRVYSQIQSMVDYLELPSWERRDSEAETALYKDLLAIASHDPTYIDAVGLMDKNGIDVADTASGEVGSNKFTHTYVANPIRTDLPYSTVQFSPTTKRFSLYFSAPVHNANGRIIGVLRVRYNAAVLQEIINAALVEQGLEEGNIVLLDENHIRLADGDAPDLILKSIVPLPADKLAQLQAENRLPADLPAEELSTNLPEFEEGLNNMASHPVFAAETEPGGQHLEQITVVETENLPWLVVATQTQDAYLAPLAAQTRTAAVAALIVTVLVALAAAAMAQTISSPVIQLRNVANQIAGGDFNVQAPVLSNDETGQLAVAFNDMTGRLRQSFEELDRRAAELATVAEVGTATSTIQESKRLLQAVVDLTKERFQLYHSHIYLLDEEGKNLVLTAGAGEPGRIMAAERRSIPLDREQSLVARAAREQKGVAVNDVTQAPDFLPNPLLPDTRSELAVPMIVGGNVIGVFDVQSDQVGRFTESDINIQTTLAAQLAVSIQNVRVFEQSRRQAEFESMVNVIGQRIQRTTSIEETLQTAIREVGLALGATRVSVNIAGRQTEPTGKENMA